MTKRYDEAPKDRVILTSDGFAKYFEGGVPITYGKIRVDNGFYLTDCHGVPLTCTGREDEEIVFWVSVSWWCEVVF